MEMFVITGESTLQYFPKAEGRPVDPTILELGATAPGPPA